MNQFDSINTPPNLEFDKNRRRVKECPCGKSNRDVKFAPYVGFEDKGYCHSCGETFLPELPDREDWVKPAPRLKPTPKPTSFIEEGLLKRTLSKYTDNHLAVYLKSLFGEEVASNLLEKYSVGTSKKWDGATIFWQKDIDGKIRTGKIMLYSPTTGKRIKEPRSYFGYAHTELKLSEFNLKQCLFGEHLLKDDTRPVAIAESEKTAIIASHYLPQFIWLACGGSAGLTDEKCKVLDGRDVMLTPDLSKPEAKVNCYDLWCRRAEELNRLIPDSYFQVSQLLENDSTEEEKREGLDLADYLINLNHQDFQQPESKRAVTADVVKRTAIEHVITPVPEPIPIVGSKQASFDKLKEKYPAMGVLVERLELELY